MPEPEWSDFRILIAVKRGGSVAAAARLLGIDHSTVSRRLLALETSVRASLVVRGGRECCWTEAGRTLLAAAESLESTIAAAVRDVHQLKQGVEGTVRMSVPPGLTSVMSSLLQSVRSEQPGLAIELCGENRSVDLAKGEADLALRMAKPTDPALVCKALFEFGWVACASDRYIATHGAPNSPDELPKHSVIRYAVAMHGASGPRWLEEHRGSALISAQVDNTEVAGHSVASGSGIGVIPVFVEQGRPGVVRIFPEPVAFTSGYLVYHESVRDTAKIRAALAQLSTVFETNAALLRSWRGSR